jgi:EmrB/QacA subfamily drug resistance transporter
MNAQNAGRQVLGVELPLLRLVGIVALGAIMSLLDSTIVNVAIETLTEEFDAALSTVGWVSTGYLLAFAISIPIAGWAVDRFGSRRVWLFGLTTFVSMSVLAGLSTSIEMLVAFRVLQGFAGGLLEPTMLTVVARAAGPARVGRVLGLTAIPVTLGPILGPVLGGFLLEYTNWHWLFFVNLPIGLLAIWLAIRYIPRDGAEGDATQLFDLRGVLLLSPGFAALIYAISEVGLGKSFTDRTVLAAAIAGVGLLLGYGWYALRTRVVPLIDLRLFRNRQFSASVTVMTLLGGIFISSAFLLPLYYQQTRGFSVVEVGLLMMPQGIGGMAVMPFTGRFSDRFGARPLVMIGGVIGTLVMIVFATADADTSVTLLATVSVFFGAGLGFVGPPVLSSVYRSVQPDLISRATSAMFILTQIGGALGIATFALILQRTGSDGNVMTGFERAFWTGVAGSLVILVASQILPGRDRRDRLEPAAGRIDTSAVAFGADD